MELNRENVESIMKKCLFTKPEIDAAVAAGEKHPQEAVVVKAVAHTFGFHPERLKGSEDDVVSLLRQLPEEFHEGWSFLNAPLNRDKEQWGEQRDAEALISLGIGLGYVTECIPGLRAALPGGVPYYQVTV